MAGEQPDEQLLAYATPTQARHYRAWVEHGSTRRAADATGYHRSVIARSIALLKEKAARAGYAPEYGLNRPTPPGFLLKGVSTLRNARGEVVAEWQKTDRDRDAQALILQRWAEAWAEEALRIPEIPAPRITRAEMTNLYVVADAHMGMLSWPKETGEKWDTREAGRVLRGCFALMMDDAPSAEAAVVVFLGDLMHYDSLIPVTPTGGHQQDTDTRLALMVDATVDVLRTVIDLAARKHREVRVIVAEGNHDMSHSISLLKMVDIAYEQNPRVTVDRSVTPYIAHRFGDVALGFHHGHLKKFEGLPSLFLSEFREFALAEHRYIHCGHLHHHREQDKHGCTVIQHPTLAARDAYAARHGWKSRRAARRITYHHRFGEVASAYVTPEMLAA